MALLDLDFYSVAANEIVTRYHRYCRWAYSKESIWNGWKAVDPEYLVQLHTKGKSCWIFPVHQKNLWCSETGPSKKQKTFVLANVELLSWTIWAFPSFPIWILPHPLNFLFIPCQLKPKCMAIMLKINFRRRLRLFLSLHGLKPESFIREKTTYHPAELLHLISLCFLCSPVCKSVHYSHVFSLQPLSQSDGRRETCQCPLLKNLLQHK